MRYNDLQEFITSNNSYWLDAAINATASHINNAFNSWSSRHQQKKAIEAQKEMNERNIKFQQDINDQNIAFQKEVNDIMRHDANNAIGIKKQDLINSGYSTADPSLTGAQTASSLGTPDLTAPHVESEFTPEMAEMTLQTGRDISSGLLATARLMSDVQLQKALAREHNVNADRGDIENGWLDAEHSAQFTALIQSIDNMKKEGKLTDANYQKVNSEIRVMDKQLELLGHNIKLAEMNNKFRPIEFVNSMNQAIATLGEIQARIANIKADTNNKYKQGLIYDLDREFRRIEVDFARCGINFNSSGLLDSIGRIIYAPNGSDFVPKAIDFIGGTLTGIVKKFGFDLDDSEDSSSPVPTFGKFLKGTNSKFVRLFRTRVNSPVPFDLTPYD